MQIECWYCYSKGKYAAHGEILICPYCKGSGKSKPTYPKLPAKKQIFYVRCRDCDAKLTHKDVPNSFEPSAWLPGCHSKRVTFTCPKCHIDNSQSTASKIFGKE